MVVKEGLFLYEHGVPPYNGGVYHQVAPPRLGIWVLIKSGAAITGLLFDCRGTGFSDCDCVFCCRCFMCAIPDRHCLGESREMENSCTVLQNKTARADCRFLFNPFTVATCLGRSSSVFSNLAVLASIAHAHQGTVFTVCELMEGLGGSAMVELAMASYLSLYPALLLPPLLLCRNIKVPTAL